MEEQEGKVGRRLTGGALALVVVALVFFAIDLALSWLAYRDYQGARYTTGMWVALAALGAAIPGVVLLYLALRKPPSSPPTADDAA